MPTLIAADANDSFDEVARPVAAHESARVLDRHAVLRKSNPLYEQGRHAWLQSKQTRFSRPQQNGLERLARASDMCVVALREQRVERPTLEVGCQEAGEAFGRQ